MATKYKLLRDLPDAKAGEEYIKYGDENAWYLAMTVGHMAMASKVVENTPNWFQQIPDRIVVEAINYRGPEKRTINVHSKGPFYQHYSLLLNETIDNSHISAIIDAIESIVNNDPRRHWDDQNIADAWHAGWEARQKAEKLSSDERMEKFMDGGYDYAMSIQPKHGHISGERQDKGYSEEDLQDLLTFYRNRFWHNFPDPEYNENVITHWLNSRKQSKQ